MQQSNAEERLFASLMYFTSFFTTIIGPAILWFLKRDSAYVLQHGIMYLNFIVSYFLYQVAASFLYFIGIGFVINGILAMMMIIFTIIAGIYAYEGTVYRIPLVIRLFS